MIVGKRNHFSDACRAASQLRKLLLFARLPWTQLRLNSVSNRAQQDEGFRSAFDSARMTAKPSPTLFSAFPGSLAGSNRGLGRLDDNTSTVRISALFWTTDAANQRLLGRKKRARETAGNPTHNTCCLARLLRILACPPWPGVNRCDSRVCAL